MENVEIKARCRDLESIARSVAALGAVLESTVRQMDTYFNVSDGRLKLRQTDGVSQTLIFYRRPNQSSPKVSRYELVALTPGQEIGPMLTQALGIRAVVRKHRQLWRLDNVRIHLDEVEGLGTFIEFEVEVTPGRDIAGCRAQAQSLLAALEIAESDLVDGSYAELVV